MKTIAVFGLGSMGYGMAQSLLRAGHTVYGFDVVPEQEARFRDEGGASGELAAIAPKLDAVVVVVLNAAQTEEVLFGAAGVVPMLRSGAVVLSCATVAPDFARRMAEACAARQVHYLDSPISGGSVKAAQGRLSIMASGSKATFDAAQPVGVAFDQAALHVIDRGNRAAHTIEICQFSARAFFE